MHMRGARVDLLVTLMRMRVQQRHGSLAALWGMEDGQMSTRHQSLLHVRSLARKGCSPVVPLSYVRFGTAR